MKTLPAPLAPWVELRALFPAPGATALAHIAGRLAPLFGPFVSRSFLQDHPDGFGGVASRGNLHRLLPSEWLLASEMPEEFLRRAVMGEQLFFEQSRKQDRRGPACAVLLDGGPAQFGSPRLVQMSLLVLLSRRALAAGSRFQWGVLQDRSLELTTGLAAPDIRRFLRARSFENASTVHSDAWAGAADHWRGHDEVWLIGANPAWPGPATNPGTVVRRVLIEDVLDPAKRSLDVRVLSPGAEPRGLRLDLPEPDRDCANLLCNPFGAASQEDAATQSGVESNVLLDHHATHALIRTSARSVESYSAQPPHRTRVWHTPFNLLLAAGRFRARYCMAGELDGRLMLHWVRRRRLLPIGPYTVEGDEFVFPTPSDPLEPCYVCEENNLLSVLVLDRRRSLFRLEVFEGRCRARKVIEHVMATGRFGETSIVALGRVPGAEPFALFGFSGGMHHRPLPIHAVAGACLGAPTQAPYLDLTWEDSSGVWRMCNEPARRFEPPPGSQAVGLVTRPDGSPRLLAISPDRLRLTLSDSVGEHQQLRMFPSPVASASFAAGPGVAACRTVDRGIYFVDARSS